MTRPDKLPLATGGRRSPSDSAQVPFLLASARPNRAVFAVLSDYEWPGFRRLFSYPYSHRQSDWVNNPWTMGAVTLRLRLAIG